MNILATFFGGLISVFQPTDTLIEVPNLNAFTHPEFFYSNDCECGMFNRNFFQLEIFDSITPTLKTNCNITPPSFETGHSVVIVGKQGDYFRIKFIEEEHPVCYECGDSAYYVKKRDLGTWIYNFNDSSSKYDSIPLYEKPSLNSKIITNVEPSNSVAVILDIIGDWMLVETIGKKKEKGWLCPQNQCGNPNGVEAGTCY